MQFGQSESPTWTNNFRDLNGAITRMCMLAAGGRIDVDTAREEIGRRKLIWQPASADEGSALVERMLSAHQAAELDRFDPVQLADVLTVCTAGRLRKFLGRFGIQWSDIARRARE